MNQTFTFLDIIGKNGYKSLKKKNKLKIKMEKAGVQFSEKIIGTPLS
jgi:hypothetical protein